MSDRANAPKHTDTSTDVCRGSLSARHRLIPESRLTGADVYAVYDRAIGNLEAIESGRLPDHRELPDVLRRHQISLI